MVERVDSNHAGSDQAAEQPDWKRAVVPAATVLYEPDLALLDALLSALDRHGRRLYVYLNGPVSEQVDARLAVLADAVLIRSAENVGLGAALNAVVEAAARDGGEKILLLDQDSTPDPTLPDRLLERFRQHDSPGAPLAVLAPTLITPSEGGYLPIRYAWRNPAGAAHFAPTSGSLLSIPAFKAVGPFRADFFIAGIDVEWGFRSWARGFRTLIASDLKLQHRWGTPAGNAGAKIAQILRHSDIRNFYYIRNTVHCLRLPHIPVGWKLRSAGTLAGQAALLLHDKRYCPSTFRLIGHAVAAGLRGRLGPYSPTA